MFFEESRWCCCGVFLKEYSPYWNNNLQFCKAVLYRCSVDHSGNNNFNYVEQENSSHKEISKKKYYETILTYKQSQSSEGLGEKIRIEFDLKGRHSCDGSQAVCSIEPDQTD